MYTTQKQIIQAFKQTYPDLDYKSKGTEYATDTRCTFIDYVDSLQRYGLISETLAARVTLKPPQSQTRKPHPVHIEGRRWFDRKNGNTYNSVTIHLSDQTTVYLSSTYGYGDYYLQRAEEHIRQNYKFKNPDRLRGTRFLREIAKCSYSVADLTRQRDL